MRFEKFIWLLFLWPPLIGNSQQIYSLTDCVNLALDNNLNIQNSRYDQQLYDERIEEVKRTALPNIAFGAEYNYYLEVPTSVAPASAFAPEQEGFVPLQFGLPHQSTYALQLQQIIYNPALKVGLKAAKVSKEMGSLQLKQAQEEVIFQVASTYYNAQVIAEQIHMLKANSLSLDTLIESTDQLEKSGLVNKTDVDRLRLNKSGIDNNVANLEANYTALINNLKVLTNLPASTPFAIETTLHPGQAETLETPALNFANRTALQLLNKKKEVLALQEQQIHAGSLPYVSGVANYGLMGQGDWSEDFYKHYDFSYIGLQVNWSIFDGKVRKSQKKQKRIEMEQLMSNIEMTKRTMENEHTNALAKLDVQVRELNNQEQSMQLAEEVYQNIQLQYNEGIAGVQQIIESENELILAQTNYLNAWVRLQQAYLDLAKANGTLLQHLN